MKKELKERLFKFEDTNVTFDINYMTTHGYGRLIKEIIKFIKMFSNVNLLIEIKVSDDKRLSGYMLVITDLSESIIFKHYWWLLEYILDKRIIAIKMAYTKKVLSLISVMNLDGEYGIFI